MNKHLIIYDVTSIDSMFAAALIEQYYNTKLNVTSDSSYEVEEDEITSIGYSELSTIDLAEYSDAVSCGVYFSLDEASKLVSVFHQNLIVFDYNRINIANIKMVASNLYGNYDSTRSTVLQVWKWLYDEKDEEYSKALIDLKNIDIDTLRSDIKKFIIYKLEDEAVPVVVEKYNEYKEAYGSDDKDLVLESFVMSLSDSEVYNIVSTYGFYKTHIPTEFLALSSYTIHNFNRIFVDNLTSFTVEDVYKYSTGVTNTLLSYGEVYDYVASVIDGEPSVSFEAMSELGADIISNATDNFVKMSKIYSDTSFIVDNSRKAIFLITYEDISYDINFNKLYNDFDNIITAKRLSNGHWEVKLFKIFHDTSDAESVVAQCERNLEVEHENSEGLMNQFYAARECFFENNKTSIVDSPISTTVPDIEEDYPIKITVTKNVTPEPEVEEEEQKLDLVFTAGDYYALRSKAKTVLQKIADLEKELANARELLYKEQLKNVDFSCYDYILKKFTNVHGNEKYCYFELTESTFLQILRSKSL